jgi:Ankyrin repeat
MGTPSDTIDTLIHAIQHGTLEEIQAIVLRTPALIRQRDSRGVTPLHHAAYLWRRPIVDLLIAQGAEINAQDAEFGATPAGWAIEFMRERGAFLGIELVDLAHAIERRDTLWVARFLRRFPSLREATATDGTPFQQLALESGNSEILNLFQLNFSEKS